MEHEHVFVSKELVREIMPEIEARMQKKMRMIAMNTIREVLQEKKETFNAMKLSEESFGRLWESKEDEIWDEYQTEGHLAGQVSIYGLPKF